MHVSGKRKAKWKREEWRTEKWSNENKLLSFLEHVRQRERQSCKMLDQKLEVNMLSSPTKYKMYSLNMSGRFLGMELNITK